MALMIGNGALAGSLSPFSPTGVVANGVMARLGFPGLEWQTFYNNILGHTFVAFAGSSCWAAGGSSGAGESVTGRS